MSFQQPESDVSWLNREACERTQDVHPATFEVLHWAREIAQASEGCFDITVAAKLVEWGFLPAPDCRHQPEPKADWRDVELGEDYSVRFRRPLWIDLSGIAKSYAVDRAVENCSAMARRRHVSMPAATSRSTAPKLRPSLFGPNS